MFQVSTFLASGRSLLASGEKQDISRQQPVTSSQKPDV
jgi:hypothetical protein